MLEADIDVFSTVNVQHLESLNDQVAELTGVRVRETLPDEVLARADEVVLLDLTPEALITRLRAGKVYPEERVPAALGGFFKVENLQALREVALRQVAEDVEAKRLTRDTLYEREERLFGSAAPPIAERLLALVPLDARAEPVVRRAWRSSQRLAADLDILVVRDPHEEPSAKEREQLEALRRLAAVLGAALFVETGEDVAAGRRARRARARHHLHPDGTAAPHARHRAAARAAGHAVAPRASRRGRPHPRRPAAGLGERQPRRRRAVSHSCSGGTLPAGRSVPEAEERRTWTLHW